MAQGLCEKQKQLQATIADQTKREKANNRTLQELREEQKQLQATIDGLIQTVEALNETEKILCGRPEYVSTCRGESVTIRKLTEIPPAINIANDRSNAVVW
jgi:predicted RNase H-like nuclease (RuvC/YqgF family)